MTQTLDVQTESAERALVRRGRRHRAREAQRPIDAFLSELDRMSAEERIRASRYSMTLHERNVYAARYPDEVPLVNGELEWIALTLE